MIYLWVQVWVQEKAIKDSKAETKKKKMNQEKWCQLVH